MGKKMITIPFDLELAKNHLPEEAVPILKDLLVHYSPVIDRVLGIDGDRPTEGRGKRPMHTYQYQPGDRPLDGYTIKSAAGHGGFGEVYYAVSDAGRAGTIRSRSAVVGPRRLVRRRRRAACGRRGRAPSLRAEPGLRRSAGSRARGPAAAV